MPRENEMSEEADKGELGMHRMAEQGWVRVEAGDRVSLVIHPAAPQPEPVHGDMVMVPREPTEGMTQAAAEAWDATPGMWDAFCAAIKAGIAAAPAPVVPADQWKAAIDDELVCCHIGTTDSFPDARAALKNLIDWHVSVALDPAVSSDAQALIDKVLSAAPVVREPLIDEMDAVASKYAHKLALDLECVLSDYNGKWWDTAMQTLGEYRSAMNAVHERESPTHMGEPVLPQHGITRAAMADPITLPPLPQGYEPHELPADYTGPLWIEGQMHAHAAAVSAAKDKEIERLRERVRVLEDALRHVDDCLSIDDYGDYALLPRFDSDIVSAARKGAT